jgi:sugar phosphate isomerase/epimerase
MSMQPRALLPSGLSPQAVREHVMQFDHAGHVRRLAAHGFNPVELGGDMALFFPQAFTPAAVDALQALKAETGLGFTVHLPLWSVEPSTPLKPVRDGSVKALVDCIRATRRLEPEVYVLHATGALAAEFYRMRLPELARPVILQQFQAAARASVQALLAETGLPSRRLAVETIEFPFDLTLDLAEDLDLSVCFDTGHVLVGFSGPVDFFHALERALPRLAEVHLHDGPWQGPQHRIGYGKDHQPLGAGDLDVGRLLDWLKAADFNGPLVFELDVDDALASLEAIQALRPRLVNAYG